MPIRTRLLLRTLIFALSVFAVDGFPQADPTAHVVHAQQSADDIPELTHEAVKWGQDAVDHSMKIVEGRNVNKPPFVAPDAAESLALAASVVEKAARMDLASLGQDADFQALLNLIQTRLDAGDTPTFEETQALYDALNSKQNIFEPPVEKILGFVLGLVGFTKHAQHEERRTEGVRFLFPSRHPAQDFDADFVNGVQTELINGLALTAYLGLQFGIDVNHIHNEAGPTWGDGLQALLQRYKISKDFAVRQVAAQVRQHVQSDRPYLLICHSQGAAICQQGVVQALTEGSPEEQIKISQILGVLTLGGFTKDTDFPSGIHLESICAPGDPVCPAAGAIDFTNPPGAIKNALRALAKLVTKKQHSLTDFYIPPENRRVPGDMRELVIEARRELVDRISPAKSLAGRWVGVYAWNCDDPGDGSRSGTAQVVFSITDGGSDAVRYTGTASYRGSTASIMVSRYTDVTLGQFGTVLKGTLSPTGMTVEITVSRSGFIINNVFTGVLNGRRIAGTTLNGDGTKGLPGGDFPGCSASFGPAGTFSVDKE